MKITTRLENISISFFILPLLAEFIDAYERTDRQNQTASHFPEIFQST
jgi:hypothetical protein